MNKTSIKSLVSQVKKVQKGLKIRGNYIYSHNGKVVMTYKSCYGIVFDMSLLEGADIAEIEENEEQFNMITKILNPYLDLTDVTEDFYRTVEDKRVVNGTVYEFGLRNEIVYYNKKLIDMLNRFTGKKNDKKVYTEKIINKTSPLIFVGDEVWGIVLPILIGR